MQLDLIINNLYQKLYLNFIKNTFYAVNLLKITFNLKIRSLCIKNNTCQIIDCCVIDSTRQIK